MSMTGEASGISETSTSNSIPETSSISTNNVEKLDYRICKKEVVTQINSEGNSKNDTSDSHLNRLHSLRNELNYINDTDWMYESLEKKPQL
ncbi:uncharacterized protein LOC132789749 [Drosophila nasuta]|uniref:Uncharacterized protein LOC117572179 n=1 Tax=Drosophila albomicans TaxID=7291 RepID=A0A6P8Z0Y7_DROAB|nr:uncharacterized protein LOC117572179 [Drosophila albomicans]XP_060653968.1 uncharacterized protein LOC132789749 [Drosophila nasuta]